MSPVIGIRMRGSSTIRFFQVDAGKYETGDRIALTTDGETDIGVVIVPPGQIDATMFRDRDVSIAHVAHTDGAESPAIPDDTQDSVGPVAGRLIGGIGFRDPSRRGISQEAAAYQHAKCESAMLGKRLQTPHGSGMVVARDVFKKTATIRYDDYGNEETLPDADVMDMPKASREDSK